MRTVGLIFLAVSLLGFDHSLVVADGLSLVQQITSGATAAEGSFRPKPNLSPADWPQKEFDELWSRSFESGRNPELRLKTSATSGSSSGIVTGSADPLGMYAGVQAMKHGGNAMDACVAAAAAQVTLASGAFVSHAGIASVVFRPAGGGKEEVVALDATWRPAKGADYSEGVLNMSNIGNSVLVGGFMAALEEGSATYGKLDFSSLLDAAVYFAESGSPRTSILRYNAKFSKVLNRTEEGRELYRKLWSAPYPEINNFTQPEMARVLRCVQKEGSSCMYSGSWGRNASDTIQEDYHGLVNYSDYSGYKTSGWIKPRYVNITNQGESTHFYLPAAPNYGGRDLFVTIRVLEKLRDQYIRDAGNNNITAWNPLYNMTTMGLVAQLVRWQQLVDGLVNLNGAVVFLRSHFWAIIPANVGTLEDFNKYAESSEYADQLFSALDTRVPSVLGGMNASNMSWFNQGFHAVVGSGNEKKRREGDTDDDEKMRQIVRNSGRGTHSDALTATDSEGNVCSIIHTINTGPWGTGIFVDGIALSDAGFGSENLQGLRLNSSIAEHGSIIPGPLQNMLILQEDEESGGGGSAVALEKNESQKDKWTALSVVGGSLQDTTAILLAELFVGYPSEQIANFSEAAMNGPQFRFISPVGSNNPNQIPIPLSYNKELNCSAVPFPIPACSQITQQLNSFSPKQESELPAWISENLIAIDPVLNEDLALSACGISVTSTITAPKLAAGQEISSQDGETGGGNSKILSGVATPCLNGGAFGYRKGV